MNTTLRFGRLLAGVLLSTAPSAMALDEAAMANNAFCFSLLQRAGGTSENAVFSPFSIWSALAMTSAGAEAETLQQMQKVLALPSRDSHSLAGKWSGSLREAKGVQMKVANRLWGRSESPFRAEFLRLAEKHYGAALESLDFRGNLEGSRR